jgi:LmbE family N-acetylglucosaminyl deacetylase
LGFEDGKVILDLSSREKIAELMTIIAPDIVVTHHLNDKPWADHSSTSEIVTAAWDYAKLPKGYSLYYWDTPIGREVQPTVWIDTSDTFERKLKAVEEFKLELEWFGRHPETLLPKNTLEKLPQLLEVEAENESEKCRLIGKNVLGYCIKTIDSYRGLQIGARYAEAFELKAGKRLEL